MIFDYIMLGIVILSGIVCTFLMISDSIRMRRQMEEFDRKMVEREMRIKDILAKMNEANRNYYSSYDESQDADL
jgi:hypothetical protein